MRPPCKTGATLCCLAACGNSLFVERVGLLVGEHAAAGEKPQALRRLQREAMTTPRHHVDDELGVLPIAELVEIHVDRTTTDLTEILVVAADTELACRLAHRRRAVAAAALLMKHQRTVLGLQLLDRLQRGVSGENPFDHFCSSYARA